MSSGGRSFSNDSDVEPGQMFEMGEGKGTVPVPVSVTSTGDGKGRGEGEGKDWGKGTGDGKDWGKGTDDGKGRGEGKDWGKGKGKDWADRASRSKPVGGVSERRRGLSQKPRLRPTEIIRAPSVTYHCR